MKTVREVIRRAPVWVNPDHTIETAIILMRGHNLEAIPVLDGPNLSGIVLHGGLLGNNPQDPVSSAMVPGVPSISSDASVRDAADIMTQSAIATLPVVDDGKLIGVITAADLLPELGRSYDPLTGLHWSDSLREWAIEHLKGGSEITVLFVDLNGFGHFNKQYGHIIGDEVLRAVARTLVDLADEETDTLCRYGGDEFAVATIRPAEEAAELGATIARRIADIDIPEIDGEHISCSVGQFGGKRTKEREHTHYAATMNSLINLASRDATAHKKAAVLTRVQNGGAETAAPIVENTPRLKLARVDVRRTGRTAKAQIDLQIGSDAALEAGARGNLRIEGLNRFTATSTADTDEDSLLRLVADTTASALRSFLPQGYDVVVTDVVRNVMTDGHTVVTTVGQFVTPAKTTPIAGSAVVSEDANRAAAASVLAAVNRSIGLLFTKTGP
jgi:IMP dehydrogenase